MGSSVPRPGSITRRTPTRTGGFTRFHSRRLTRTQTSNRTLDTKSCCAVGVVILVAACGGRGSENRPAPALATGSEVLTPPGVASVRDTAVDRSHYESVIAMIRGKAPGLQVIEVAPGQFELRIRGVNQSLQAAGEEPLVVLDGMASSRPAGQLLMSLNPQDVVSIEVLKDVASTAVYGTRGANGVLIIRTERRH
ncbi:MAG: hypothetical protein E6I08_16530 [Chloroflexi bacterium]|nr:MAG: hypothetical protein E6I08_16530 [Chloroflexota bacterium]